MKKYFVSLLVFLIIFSVFIAGCATLSVYAKVNPDTTISNYKVTIETTSMVYGFISGGLKSNFDENLYNYDEKWTGDKVTITLTAKTTLKTNDPVNWTITKVNNHMIYDDKRMMGYPPSSEDNEYSNAMANSISMHYYLEMPGKIITSTADKTDNNKAEWHLQGNEISTTPIHAESELPAIPFIPGFEALLGVIGIVGSVLIYRHYQQDQG